MSKSHSDILKDPLTLPCGAQIKILSGVNYASAVKPLTTDIKLIDKMALLEVTWYEQQLSYIAKGKQSKPNQSIWFSLAKTMVENGFQVFRKRRA
ncbi:MAG: hypothetical protein HF978_21535 [Desulfobacteraceae bacterium]|nr:hypothetical protein [Desulfobacteraceae bacterium]MBC2758130.1 hypothetical protein [Desulfobacteraceae bacterium]